MEYRGEEKRAAPRVQMSTTARAWLGDEEISFRLVNLSSLGFLAIPGKQLPVGTLLLMELSLPEHEALHLAAEVVREDTVDGDYAVGLQLKDVPAALQRVLAAFVTRTRKKTRPHDPVVR